MDTCEYDDSLPYRYFLPNGSLVTHGVYTDVPGYSAPVCVFSTELCVSNMRGETSDECCKPNSSQPPFWVPLVIGVVGYETLKQVVGSWLRGKEEARPAMALAREAHAKDDVLFVDWYLPDLGPGCKLLIPGHAHAYTVKALGLGETARASALTDGSLPITLREGLSAGASAGTSVTEREVDDPMEHMFRQYDGLGMLVLFIVFMLSLSAGIMQGSIMAPEIQATLDPTERSAELAISSFIAPVREIFAFLEDGMVVRVSYAIAAGRNAELNLLLHISIVGGIATGLLAFLCMMAIALSPSAAVLLDPSSASNQQLLEEGCSLVPEPATLLAAARSYWLLATAVWIGGFMRKGVDGFMLGSGYLITYLMPSILSGGLPLVIWFVGKPATSTNGFSPLTLLGVAMGTDDWINAIALLLFIACARDLQKRYDLRLLLPWRKAPPGAPGETSPREVMLKVLRESSELMIIDLVIQVSRTATIYLAASQSAELAYKLSAPAAAYWVLGPANVQGYIIMFRTMGSKLIANGRHRAYLQMFLAVFLLSLIMSVYSVIASIIWRDEFTQSYGKTACVYASSANCTGAYANVFMTPGGGTETSAFNLPGVFVALGPVVGVRMIFMTARVGLNTSHDFRYMSLCALAAGIAFIPMLLVCHYYWRSALGYYLSMNLVEFLLAILYGARMVGHVHKLIKGEPGPWTEHMGEVRRATEERLSKGRASRGPSRRDSSRAKVMDSRQVLELE